MTAELVIKAVLDFLKSPRTSVAAGVTLLAIALVPKNVWGFLGIDALSGQIRGWVVIGGVFCTTYGILGYALPALETRWNKRRFKQDRIAQLLNLTKQEKEIVAKFIREDKSSVYFGFASDHGVICGLVHQGVLYWPTNSRGYENGPSNLQPWVQELASSNSKVRNALLAPDGSLP